MSDDVPAPDQGAAAPPALALAQRLRSLRLDRGLTQEQVAERADLHPGYVQKLEGGQRFPSLHVLMRLARALDVAVVDLVAVLDRPRAGGSAAGAGDPLESFLRTCTTRQRAMVLDFIRLLRNHGC